MSKIMLIDDDQKIRDIVQRFLEHRGHQVIQVSDGALGMEAIRRDRPDLIVLDVLMPGMDGCALGYHLKFQSEFSHIPIMMLTSLADRPYLAKDIAADFFMTKPFSGEKLVDKVEEILASGKVKVGIQQTKLPVINMARKRICKWYAFWMAGFAAVFCGMFLYSRGVADTVAEVGPAGSREISVMADRLFIYFIPVCIAIMLYALYLLKKTLNTSSGEKENA